MPFVALVQKQGSDEWKKVDITEYRTPKKDFADCAIKCQACGTPMIVKHTIMVQAHFAHIAGEIRDCAYEHEGGGESEEHKYSKLEVMKRLRHHGAYVGSTIEQEVILKPINRIADIMVTWPDGTGEIHEIQLSSITTDKLEQRTSDYQKLGYDVTWWLGKNANTRTNQEWTKENFNYTATLDITTQYQTVPV